MRGLLTRALPVKMSSVVEAFELLWPASWLVLPDRAPVRMSREAGLMTLDLYPMSKSNVCDLSQFFDRVRVALSEPLGSARPNGRRQSFGGPSGALCASGQKMMIIGNENDQVSKGQLVDALACTGDEGRDTLR